LQHGISTSGLLGSLLLALGLAGCEQVAELDQLHIVPDAGTKDAGTKDAGEEEDAGPDPHSALRDLCVETINAHRASLDLAPLERASRAQERCADQGAETDSAMNMVHYAAQHRSATCSKVGLGAENSCPNWHFGGDTGNESAADALVHCIDRMWSQGEPPLPVADCQKDLEPDGCYAQHGDWINLTSTRAKYVACGVALGDDTLWVNQDFTVR
jgi:hypothetical protein